MPTGIAEDSDIFLVVDISMDFYKWPLLLTWFNFNPSMDK